MRWVKYFLVGSIVFLVSDDVLAQCRGGGGGTTVTPPVNPSTLAGTSLGSDVRFNPHASSAASPAFQLMAAQMMQQQFALQQQIAARQQAQRQQKLESRRYRAEQARAQLAERRRRTRELLAAKASRSATVLASYQYPDRSLAD